MRVIKENITLPDISSKYIDTIYNQIQNEPRQDMVTAQLAFSFLKDKPNDFELIRMTIAVLDSKACYSTNLQMDGKSDVYSRIAHGIQALDENSYTECNTVDYITKLRDNDFCFSFASKWCAFKNPDYYHIFDSYKCAFLYRINKLEKFTEQTINEFYKPQIFEYSNWHQICEDFRLTYAKELTPWELDKLLYTLGKKYFE